MSLIPDLKSLNKRTSKNPKYDHIKTKLDIGFIPSEKIKEMEGIRKLLKYRNNEIFKRVKVSTLAKMILEVASVSDLNQSDAGESYGPQDGLSVVPDHTDDSPQPTLLSQRLDATDNKASCRPVRSTLLSVISGVGEMSFNRNDQQVKIESVSSPESANRPYIDCPFLLLDVRDRDQYDCCHIISAHSFPMLMQYRTMNPYIKEVLEYKNAAGRIIIVYDEDERIASKAVNNMCERGFENVFMLSGGLKIIARKFPEGMTTGSFPTSCLPSSTSSKGKRTSCHRQQTFQAAEKRCRFTPDELAKIQEQLEKILPSNSTASHL